MERMSTLRGRERFLCEIDTARERIMKERESMAQVDESEKDEESLTDIVFREVYKNKKPQIAPADMKQAGADT
jgi:hypothetical protein